MPEPRLLGKYELLDEIGRGGFATVYRARDTRMGREVALKVIHGNFAQEPEFVQRFKHEVQTAARLRHPNIVTVYDYDDADGVLYLAMELIEGSSLRAYLDDRKHLTLDQALPILKQVADALDYLASQQLVHRDIKPANILLEREADRLQVKLTDFGLVRSLESSAQLTQTLSVMGTPAYMSPEQSDAQKWGDITVATDVYALGVVTYEMLCGRPPFEGGMLTVMHAHAYDQPPSPLEFVPDLGADLEEVLLQALNKTPSARYISAGALVSAMQDVQQQRQRQAQHQAALAQLIEQAQAARTAKEWLIVQGLCVQIMQIDRAHPEASLWMTEAAVELQRENQEEMERRRRAERYEEGEAALNAGQWQTAIEAFEDVAQSNPDFRDVQQKLAIARDELQRGSWYYEAIAHAEAQRWADASRVWTKVLRGRMDYRNGDAAARLLISTEGLLGQFDEAVRHVTSEPERLREALRLFDLLADSWEKSDWPTVVALAEQLLKVANDLQLPNRWLAEARHQLLARAQAEEARKRAEEIQERGRVILEEQKAGFDQAIEDTMRGAKRVQGNLTPLSVELSFRDGIAKMLDADRLTWLADGKEMVRVPAGEFLYGGNKKKINLPEFWIDKEPVTNAEYARFVAAKEYLPPAHWRGLQPPKDLIDHPVVNVSWNEAVAYATWAGKRLPTEQEWEKAARGTDGCLYPWGDQEPTDKHCNFGENVESTTPVGKYSPQGDSPYGCVDLAGNVWEWTDSDFASSSKVLRGGSWANAVDYVRSTHRNASVPDFRSVDLGFRCVAVRPGG